MMEKAMFSRTYTDRLLAASTKNTTIPSSSRTNMVLMLEVINCIPRKNSDFLLMVLAYFFLNT